MRAQLNAVAEFVPLQRLDYELVVAHPTEDWVTRAELDTLFDSGPIESSHLETPEVEQETLFLFQNGEVVTSSPAWTLTDAIAEINTMIRTGSAESLTSLGLPVVLTELDEILFAAAGPDDSEVELLFTAISRYIEAMAVEAGDGQLRVGFQRLSRLRAAEEDHTRDVYERLAETGVDVHVYGRPDWVPPESLAVTIHGGYTEDFLRNWFVVFRAADKGTTAAFTAHDHGSGAWAGHWTFQTDRVSQLIRYLEQRL